MRGSRDRTRAWLALLAVLGLLVEACLETVTIEGLACDATHTCGDGLACVEGFCRRPRATPGVGCDGPGDCPVGVCFQEAGVCVACTVDSDCAAGVCLDYVCVNCREDDDCATRRCDEATSTCLSCKSDPQCASGYCDEESGICAPPKLTRTPGEGTTP